MPDLLRALQSALASAEGGDITQVVASPRVRIRDKIRLLVMGLRSGGLLSFREAVRMATSRLEVVVTFLALLELLKRQAVEAAQAELFGDIEIRAGAELASVQASGLDLEFDE